MASVEAIINLESLLKEIPGGNPAGADLIHAELRDLQNKRREKDSFGEAKPVPWSDIVTAATEALKQTKDLRVGAYLAEALVREHGFVGLRDGLRLMRGLVEQFWEHVYPTSSDGSLKARANALAMLNRQLALALQQTPITRNVIGDNYSYVQWKGSKQFEIPENVEELTSGEKDQIEELKQRAAAEGKITSEQWRNARSATPFSFYEEMDALLDESWAEAKALDQRMGAKFMRVRPGLEALKQAFDAALAHESPDLTALRAVLTAAQPTLEETEGLDAFKEDLNDLLKQETLDHGVLKRAGGRLIVQTPGLDEIKEALGKVQEVIKQFLPEPRRAEPGPEKEPEKGLEIEPMPEPEKEPEREPKLEPERKPAPTSAGGISSRREALARLAEVAAYFRRTEPHSPVSYLVQRAIEWGNLSLDEWLADVINDSNVLDHLRETLGIKPDGQQK